MALCDWAHALFTLTIVLPQQGCNQKHEAVQALEVKPVQQKNDQIIIIVEEVLTIYSFTAHTVPTHDTNQKNQTWNRTTKYKSTAQGLLVLTAACAI